MRSRAHPVFEQIFQHVFLILGNEWSTDLAGKQALGEIFFTKFIKINNFNVKNINFKGSQLVLLSKNFIK